MKNLIQNVVEVKTKETSKSSYAKITKKQMQLESDKIIKMEEKKDQCWIKSTSHNFIIHGVDEAIDETKEEKITVDKKYVE